MFIYTHRRIRKIFVTLATLVVCGTVLFKYLEPFTWIQAFYFTVTTMSTVGMGDLVPSTDLTRLVVSVYILISVTLYISLAAYIGGAYLDAHTRRHK